jgi:hypothetical protein
MNREICGECLEPIDFCKCDSCNHCNSIINATIEGLILGGMSTLEAKNFTLLLKAIYNSGYNEAQRKSGHPRKG